jgi:hypothetical protein
VLKSFTNINFGCIPSYRVHSEIRSYHLF